KTINCYTRVDGENICLIWTGVNADGSMSIVYEDSGAEVSNNEELSDILDYGTTLYHSVYR
ncbi:MAG: hypothetical protein Q4B70_16930, partial [Lachnospiraceae bacterium]|nr:hypothetical protein [Lachnospiraceae bacterium]